MLVAKAIQQRYCAAAEYNSLVQPISPQSEKDLTVLPMKQKVIVTFISMLVASAALAQAPGIDTSFNGKPTIELNNKDHLNYVVGSVLINAPRELIWETLVDYENAPRIFKNLKLCQVVGTEGETKLVRQLVKPGGPVKFDYIVNLKEYKPRLIEWSRRSGAFEKVAGRWELESIEKGTSTLVTYKIHLDGGLLLPSWLLAGQVKGYLPTMLNSLKENVESKVSKS